MDEISQFIGVEQLRVEKGQRSNVTLAPPSGAKTAIYSALRQLRGPLKRMAPGQSYDRVCKWALSRILERPTKLDPALRQDLFERYFKEDAEELTTLGVHYV